MDSENINDLKLELIIMSITIGLMVLLFINKIYHLF